MDKEISPLIWFGVSCVILLVCIWFMFNSQAEQDVYKRRYEKQKDLTLYWIDYSTECNDNYLELMFKYNQLLENTYKRYCTSNECSQYSITDWEYILIGE